MIKLFFYALNLDFIPYSVVTSLLAFAASFAVIQYKVNQNTQDMKDLRKVVDENKKESDNKLDDEQLKRERLRSELIERVHDIDKKVTEIHTILTQK